MPCQYGIVLGTSHCTCLQHKTFNYDLDGCQALQLSILPDVGIQVMENIQEENSRLQDCLTASMIELNNVREASQEAKDHHQLRRSQLQQQLSDLQLVCSFQCRMLWPCIIAWSWMQVPFCKIADKLQCCFCGVEGSYCLAKWQTNLSENIEFVEIDPEAKLSSPIGAYAA